MINKKRSSKINPNEDLKLTIFYFLKKDFSPKSICLRLGWYKLNKNKKKVPQYSKLSYYLKEFKLKGNVEKLGYGTWKTTGKEVQKSTRYAKRDKRGHAFRYKINYTLLKNWDELKTYFIEKLEKQGIKPYEVKGSGNIGFIFRKRKTWICKNGTIHIWFRRGESIFDSTAKKSSDKAYYSILSTIRGLETKLKYNLQINRKYYIECLKHHYAFVNSEIAKDYVSRGINFRELRDPETKELWGLIDESYSPGEFETQSPKTAIRDNEAIDYKKSKLNVK